MAHIHEKIDFTVGVFIVYKDTVLLRLHEKYHIWLPVGGHVELDEDPTQAALREVKEEVGLNVVLWAGNKCAIAESGNYKELIPPVGMNRHPIGADHEHVDFTYFASAVSDAVVPENVDDEWKWLKKDELNSIELSSDVRSWAELALDTLGEK